MRRGSDWRRYATAYVCSILIHALALVLAVLFVLQAVISSGAPELAGAPDTTIEVIPPTVVPSVAPLTVTPPPPPPPRPVVVALPATARPVVHRPPPAPHELARIVKTAPPQPAPLPPAPTAEPTEPPRHIARAATPEPTARPTVAPTLPPTPEPTERATFEPVTNATFEPAVRATFEPAPAPAPTERPTPESTARPMPAPTARPTAAPTARPTAAPTLAPVAVAVRTAAPIHSGAAPAPAATHPGHVPGPVAGTTGAAVTAAGPRVEVAESPRAAAPVAAAPGAGTAVSPASAGPGPASLNDKLRAALPTGPVATIKHYDLGGYSSDRMLDAYEASLAPPLEILLKTFGLIYTRRSTSQADSIAYVYERTKILGVEVCRAYTIVEHPLRAPGPNADHIGPSGVAMSGRPAADAIPGPLPDLKPEVTTEIVPCNAKGMIKVAPGSMTSPAPRRLQE